METFKTINVKVQGWDVQVSDCMQVIEIAKTNIRNMDVNSSKVVKYAEMLMANPNKYPFVIVEEDKKYPGFYNIIDGAHRIKALLFNEIKTVNALFVVKHNR